MNKYQKLLTGAVIVLIIVNVLLMGFIWRGHGRDMRSHLRPRHQVPQGPFFQRDLDLDHEQLAVFQDAFRSHQRKMQPMHEELRRLKRDLHRTIILDDPPNREEAMHRFLEMQRAIEMESANFIASLAQQCSDQQREKLLQMFNEAVDRDRIRRMGR